MRKRMKITVVTEENRTLLHLFAMEMKKMCDQWSNVNNEPLMLAYAGNCLCSLLSAHTHSGLLDGHKLYANVV